MQALIAMGGFDVEVLYLTLEPARHCLSLSHCDEVRSEIGNLDYNHRARAAMRLETNSR
jgi:hypothetical protein